MIELILSCSPSSFYGGLNSLIKSNIHCYLKKLVKLRHKAIYALVTVTIGNDYYPW